ncbi:MAG: hypothetical protein JWQ09_1081 [Segetibacter sp.]|nr:hypothetical protein [Segetibacter sp.]
MSPYQQLKGYSSNIIAVSFLSFSNAVRLLISKPRVTDAVAEMPTTNGMTTPKA